MSKAAKTVKFIGSDASGLPLKRKQVQHACDSCRRKKKRCIHAEDAEGEDDIDALTGTLSTTPRNATVTLVSAGSSQGRMPIVLGDEDDRTKTPDQDGEESAAGAGPSGAGAADRKAKVRHVRTISSDRSSRFVGDLNPEGMFSEAATTSGASSRPSHAGAVGVWLSSALSNGTGNLAGSVLASKPLPVLDRLLLPFVREQCLTCLPPDEDFRQLRDVYLKKIHPIFPVIPRTTLLQSAAMTPADIVLRQVVCLAAAADPEMADHLRLANQGADALPFQEFAQTLSGAVRAVLDTSLIPDRVVHIRALTILSLYIQPANPEEADLPALLGGKAIHHVQTLGLHLLKYDVGQGGEELETLFCAVWALDRLNAAVYGRPCLIHERDIGANLDNCVRKRAPCFRLFLSVVQWLDQIIELYRPGPSDEASGYKQIAFIDLPVLEAMIDEAGALKVPSPLLATIEAFYHAVIILSCRLPRPGAGQPAHSTIPPPSANARRSLAAERIASAVPRDNLSPMPFVPYSVSLALSVEYRKMRHSKLPMFRGRARAAFKSNCELLRRFGDVFWSARVVAGLGERVLREMERTANSLATGTTNEAVANGTVNGTTSKTTTNGVATSTSTGQRASSGEGDGIFSDDAASGNNLASLASAAAQLAEPLEQAVTTSSSTTAVPDGTDASARPGPGTSVGTGAGAAAPNDTVLDTIDNLDLSFFDTNADIDVFGHFDPSFDLDAVDDALEANLDIRLPPNWPEWE